MFLWLFVTLGCADQVDYTMGVGAVYTTRCAAQMAIEGDTFRAKCEPPPCADGYQSVAVGHAAVALDPGVKVIGNAERTCVQDLAKMATGGALTVDGETKTTAQP